MATVASMAPPMIRTKTEVSTETKIRLPMTASGTAPKAKYRTTGQLTSVRFSQTRVAVPMNWDIATIGTASLGPNVQISTGRVTTPPPIPETPAMVSPTRAATTMATICRTSSNRSQQVLLA